MILLTDFCLSDGHDGCTEHMGESGPKCSSRRRPALIASVGYGLYQVLYKKYIVMPFDPRPKWTEDPLTEFEPPTDPPDVLLRMQETVYPLPFSLYPNLVTSCIGLSLLVLWMPVPILHALGAVVPHLAHSAGRRDSQSVS
jgi:hypothetical protein